MSNATLNPARLPQVRMNFLSWNGAFELGFYPNNRLALTLIDDQGEFEEPIACCTVNLVNHDELPEDQIYVKEYSENAGMTKALTDAGIAEKVDSTSVGFGCEVSIMRILNQDILNKAKELRLLWGKPIAKAAPELKKPGTAYLVKCDGSVTAIAPKDPNEGFQLKEVYELLDIRTVEVAYGPADRIILCDEEGAFIRPLKVNQIATRFYQEAHGPEVGIFGNVIICDNNMFR